MLAELVDSLSSFRNGRREVDRYMIHRILENELRTQFRSISKEDNEVEALLEDFENVAYSRVASLYPHFRKLFIWIRPTRTRRPRIRYDLKAEVLQLSRDDKYLKSFLINSKLLEMYDRLKKNPKKFWKELKVELDDINAKNSH